MNTTILAVHLFHTTVASRNNHMLSQRTKGLNQFLKDFWLDGSLLSCLL